MGALNWCLAFIGGDGKQKVANVLLCFDLEAILKGISTPRMIFESRFGSPGGESRRHSGCGWTLEGLGKQNVADL